MHNVPSSQIILMQNQPYQMDQFMQAVGQESFKKQSSTKSSNVKASGQKSAKKGTPASYHQRTKSDNFYNRGSLATNNTPAQLNKNLNSAQQSKRAAGVVTKNNNFIDTEQPILKVQKSNFVIVNCEGVNQSRKAPNSAHHSKKPSSSNNFAGSGQQSQKKTTKEKYLELKAMYNDLLEKHYVLAQQTNINPQFQPQISLQQNQINKTTQNPLTVNFYPGQQQQFIIQNKVDGQTTTPRLVMQNQLSSSTITSQQMINSEMHVPQQISMTIKPKSKKQEIPSNYLESNHKQVKAGLKLQLAQGQSRKAANGYHKRSASDGNEQLFKFKQASMQRYLYPQPSNQAIQSQLISAPTQNTEETIASYRGKQQSVQPSTIQPLNHQRRVSDDYQQKNKQSKQNVQQISANRQQTNSGLMENVPIEPSENLKPQVDFNIKGFLIEMRNKQDKNLFVESQSTDPQLKQNNNKQFAMIIEENSPTNNEQLQLNNDTLNSSRKLSLIDSQRFIAESSAVKQNNEFNQIIKNYQKYRIEDKRTSSPSVERKSDLTDREKRQGGYHKRVKSDVPENPKKQLFIQPSKIKQISKGNIKKKSTLHSSGSNNLLGEKITPKKQLVVQKPNFNFGNASLFDGNNSKKVINVSIDLLRDGEMDPSMLGEESNAGGGQWIVLDGSHQDLREIMTDKNSKNVINVNKGQLQMKGLASQGQSGTNEVGRQDKYKKMIQKYSGEDQILFNKPERTGPKIDFQMQEEFKESAFPNSPKIQQKDTKYQQHKIQSNSSLQNQLELAQPKKVNAPTNSIVQTAESFRSFQQPQCLVGERIDTMDSTVSDPNMSPRQKAVNKIIKHIKLSFRQTGQAPNTTVEFYRIGKVLGKGAFGKVNLAMHKLTQQFAAIKSINKQYLSEEAQTKKVMQEVVILKRTRHRNIVRLYEFFETQKHILFVIELCAGGDLLNYVRKRRRLKEDVAKYVFKQIIEGLGYCHSKQILHRDIKLDNILLNSEGQIKICDFGVSKIVKKGETMTEQCGTPAYIAPEILRDRGYEGFAVDIWSAGVVLYAMLYGTVPFKANNMSELQKLIIKAKYTLKDDVSEEVRNLLHGLLEKDPSKRLTISQILAHPWLQDAPDNMQLFTDQEKEYIKNEFTYNDTDRYNRNETDPFPEHLLDSTQNSILKNCTTKSVILAPFNSTRSNLSECQSLSNSMKELLQSKHCIKYAARVRDIDKQYEINNNAELDNGVYHKPEEDDKKEEEKNAQSSDDSLQTSFNKETSMRSDEEEEEIRQEQRKQEKKRKKSKQTEFEKLECMIQQEEQQKPEDIESPYDQEHQEYKQLKINSSDTDLKKSPRPTPHALQSAQTLILDEKLISNVELFGYPKDYLVKCLNNNELNYATSTYYLLTNQTNK